MEEEIKLGELVEVEITVLDGETDLGEKLRKIFGAVNICVINVGKKIIYSFVTRYQPKIEAMIERASMATLANIEVHRAVGW